MLGFAVVAMAQEPHAPVAGGDPPWIEVREAHVGRSARCDAAVQLGGDGRVDGVAVTGCEEPWKSATEGAVRTWRYRRSTPDHVASVRYTAPVVVRRTEQPISLDEAAVLDHPLRLRQSPLDMHVKGAGRRTRCDVEFFVDGYGIPYALDLTACPEEVRVLAEFRLMRFTFEPEGIPGRGLVPVRFRTHVGIR
jgi:hypothetical protein